MTINKSVLLKVINEISKKCLDKKTPDYFCIEEILNSLTSQSYEDIEVFYLENSKKGVFYEFINRFKQDSSKIIDHESIDLYIFLIILSYAESLSLDVISNYPPKMRKNRLDFICQSLNSSYEDFVLLDKKWSNILYS
jgi:hypothetical protein